ncbi:MAG: hypothetical protein ABIR60_09285, partial [Allosphingosinicella sp.]
LGHARLKTCTSTPAGLYGRFGKDEDDPMSSVEIVPRLVKALAALALLQAVPALACSVKESYRVPSNFELVQKADLIVLARIVSGSEDPLGPDGEVVIEPVRVLKGAVPAKPLTLFGGLHWNGRDIPPAPTPLGNSHFSAGLGSCIRVFYPRGGLVVAMFRNDPEADSGMFQLFEPFARVVEDVEGFDGVWVKAVETYLKRLASASGDSLRPAIMAKRDLLLTSSDLAERAIGGDLDDHLRRTGPQPPPPEKMQWRLVDGPLDAGAVLDAAGSEEPILLYCKTGSPIMEAKLLGRRRPGQIELAVGDRVFAAEGEAVRTEKMGSESKPMLAATLPLTEDFTSALRRNAADTGIRVDGRLQAAAPPLDVLQKLALRCSDFMRARP